MGDGGKSRGGIRKTWRQESKNRSLHPTDRVCDKNDKTEKGVVKFVQCSANRLQEEFRTGPGESVACGVPIVNGQFEELSRWKQRSRSFGDGHRCRNERGQSATGQIFAGDGC